MWWSIATQQFSWHTSQLSGDFYAAVHSYSAICMAQFPTIGRFILWLLSNLYGAVPDCREIYIGQVHSYSATYMAQFPTVRGFLWGGPQLLSNLYGAVPDCREIYTMATQQFVWRSSRLSGDFYVAVHSYSAIFMAQFSTIGGFLCGGPQLLNNLHDAVPDCREISMAFCN